MTTNYNRNGSLLFDLVPQGTLAAMFLPTIQYESTVDYAFSHVSDGSLGKNAELLIHPNTLPEVPSENHTIQQNFSALYTVFGIPSSLGFLSSFLGDVGMPDDMTLAAPIYQNNSKATEENITQETLAVDILDGENAIFTATGEDKLHTYIESDVTGLFDTLESLSGLGDLSGMIDLSQMDAVTLLNLIDVAVDQLLPFDLRPILTIVGDVVDILSDGLDIDIVPGLSSSDVTFSLNETGLEKASTALYDLVMGMISADYLTLIQMFGLDISLTKAEIGFEIFNENQGDVVLTNQIGGLSLDLGLSLGQTFGNIDLSLDFSLDQTAEILDADYFDSVSEELAGYKIVDTAFHHYYDKVRPYLKDTSAIDLRSSTAETISALEKEYETLSQEVKDMLGTFQPSDISALYDKGRTALETILANWEENPQTFTTFSQMNTCLSGISGYAFFKEALAESETGKAILEAVSTGTENLLAECQTTVDKLVSDLESYRNDPSSMETIAQDVTTYATLLNTLPSESQTYLLSEEDKATFAALAEKVSDYDQTVFDIYADSLIAKIVEQGDALSYSFLQNLLSDEKGLYSLLPSKKKEIDTVLSGKVLADESLSSSVRSTLESEIESLKTEIIENFHSSQDQESWKTYYDSAIAKCQEINRLATSCIGEGSITGEATDLLSDLDSYFNA